MAAIYLSHNKTKKLKGVPKFPNSSEMNVLTFVYSPSPEYIAA
jgi:hypothetical protein